MSVCVHCGSESDLATIPGVGPVCSDARACSNRLDGGIRKRLLTFAATPDLEGVYPRHTRLKADLLEVLSVISDYVASVRQRAANEEAYDEGMGLWPEHIVQSKQAESRAYARLCDLAGEPVGVETQQ